MSEMSLQEQIAAIDEVIEYIGQVKRDIDYLNEKVSTTVVHLRLKGLRTEITDMVTSVHMGHINDELDKLIWNMRNKDQVYLEREREHLERAGTES